MKFRFPILASLIFFITVVARSQSGNAGFVCAKCGRYENNRQAMLLHTCRQHGWNCPTTTTYYNPVPTKTREQMLKELEDKELKEAAEDANDHGVDCYEKKDWATAINYFKVALEYVPGFEDAIYNLKKAEGKLEAERLQKEKEQEEKNKQVVDQSIQTITLPSALSKYMEEADKIIVPPPSWESNMEEQVTQIRLGQNDENKLIKTKNGLIAAFDIVCTTEGLDFRVKLLLIGAKSTDAAQNEAEIVAFRQTAWYERTLQVLKDPQKAPLLIAAIKALREKKPMPTGVTPELEKMAKGTQDPSLGNSSVHMAMDAMLSKESKAAFFQTFKMEAISMLSDNIKDKAWKYVEDRVTVLKKVNDIIGEGKKLMSPLDKGAELVDKEHQPIFNSIIQNKIDELQKNIQPFKPIPEAIINVMSFYGNSKAVNN